MNISARNHVPGTVKSIKKGPINTEVVLVLEGAAEIVSVITTYSAEKLGLKEGAKAFAIMKASEVMIGVD